MKIILRYIVTISILLTSAMLSCQNHPGEDQDEEEVTETVTPVTITHPSKRDMAETVEVNAISSYLLKTTVKATANGYVQASHVRLGDFVHAGQVLFVIKTKEAEALGNTISKIDSSLNFSGTISVRAAGTGYITQLTYTSGNYVQDGEQLAEITDSRSFVFILDIPYELRNYVPMNRSIELHLPDSTVLTGQIQSALPSVDSVSQSERYIIRVSTNRVIPENLIAKVELLKTFRPNATTVPKAAVLSDEEQSEFWIMTLSNDSTAIKTPIKKGVQAGDWVEIQSPPLADSTRILVTGNYGLGDTAKVEIVNR